MATQQKGIGTKTSSTKRTTGGPAGVVKSHKSYQSVLPTGNKLLQRKWDQTYYDEHRRLIRSAKPMVDTKAPAVRGHVTSKLKKKQLQKERTDVIDRDNQTLLKKMQHIMNTGGQVQHKNTFQHHSLNEKQRQDELDRIAKENKAMLKRLEQVEPIYKVADWIDDWRRKEELTEMITAFPEGVTIDHDMSLSGDKTDDTQEQEVSVTEAEETKTEPKDSDSVENVDS
ncbi:uncharacterized protein LOC135341524 [Halichondria panicea]|uniref:uncharacterized protein LOC135341524 n=1 Tax=Halichondria panicea TaxID=6063 RepID=UPI00312B94B6